MQIPAFTFPVRSCSRSYLKEAIDTRNAFFERNRFRMYARLLAHRGAQLRYSSIRCPLCLLLHRRRRPPTASLPPALGFIGRGSICWWVAERGRRRYCSCHFLRLTRTRVPGPWVFIFWHCFRTIRISWPPFTALT